MAKKQLVKARVFGRFPHGADEHEEKLYLYDLCVPVEGKQGTQHVHVKLMERATKENELEVIGYCDASCKRRLVLGKEDMKAISAFVKGRKGVAETAPIPKLRTRAKRK